MTQTAIRDIQKDKIRIHGRTSEKGDALNLFWTLSGIELKADASEFWVGIRSGYHMFEPWLDILVDNERTQRIMLARSGETEICVFRGMERKSRKIEILRDTQAMPNDPENFLEITHIRTDGELEEVDIPKYRLEFIGDSITSAEGLCGAVGEMSWNSQCFDPVRGYARSVARILDAEINCLSQSGWGAYCSWQGRKEQALPLYYDKVCGVLSGDRNREAGAFDEWDYGRFVPDAVVVNLGTNDGGSFSFSGQTDPVDGFTGPMRKEADGKMNEEDRLAIEDAMYAFLKKLRAANPSSYILWVYGMCAGEMEDTIRSAMRRYIEETGDKRAEYMPLSDGEPGSREHPGTEVHRAAAEKIAERLKERI